MAELEPLEQVFARARDAAERFVSERRAEHVHWWACTEESCPGNGFVSAADLIARTIAEKMRTGALGRDYNGEPEPEPRRRPRAMPQ